LQKQVEEKINHRPEQDDAQNAVEAKIFINHISRVADTARRGSSPTLLPRG
jgi:hypothetical protein